MNIPDQLFESFDHAVVVAKRLENDNPGIRAWITKTTTVPPTQGPYFVLRAGGNCPFGSFWDADGVEH